MDVRPGVRISARARDFFLLHNCPNWFWGPPSLLFSGFQGYFPCVKHPGLEVDHSTSSSTDGKNTWNYTSIPVLCLHGVSWKYISFFLNNLLIIIIIIIIIITDTYVNAAG